MSQLKMFNDDLKPAGVSLKEGFSIINTLNPEYSENDYAEQWAEICTELNQEYDPALYKKFMIDDKNVLRDGIFFVKSPDGTLISTAALRSTAFEDVMGLHMVATRMNAKGNGAGKAVCAWCVNEAYKKGYRKMHLSTDDFRIPAIKIYVDLGFMPNLYEADMRNRWINVAKVIGYQKLPVINENGKHEIISI